MTYDHHKKAGNQGDVVKHIALLAAVDTILGNSDCSVFRYVDIYAGYAHNPLIKGNEWKRGIGSLDAENSSISNKHVRSWIKWYLARPTLLGGMYPGSSLIVSDIAASRHDKIQMSLWDISPSVIAELMTIYRGHGHHIMTRPATNKDSVITDADFLFIDPPGIRSNTNRDYPRWRDILVFLQRSAPKNVLLWIPVTVNTKSSPPKESEPSRKYRQDALSVSGYRATRTIWCPGGRTIGCQLIYRFPEAAVRAVRSAIESVVELTNWYSRINRNPVKHYDGDGHIDNKSK